MESPAPKRARPSNADKEARKANFLKKIFNGDQATKSSSLVKRKPTLMKKAKELETLCGIDVSIFCFDPNGIVAIWPENELQVKKMCSFYMGLNYKNKKEWNVSDLLRDKKRKIIKKKLKNKGKNIDLVISSLSNWLDSLSGDQLRDSVPELETKIKRFRDQIEFLVIRDQQQKQKQEEQSEKYCFYELESMQTRPFDYYFDPVVEFDENKINENQLICVEDYGINNGIYGYFGNPVHNYNNYYCYDMNNMVGAGAGADSSSSNSLIYSSESDSQRTSNSIYDVMPISQWSQNFDTSTNYLF